MEDRRRPSDDEYTDDGEVMVHQPSGIRVRIGEDGTVGVPIRWNEADEDQWSEADVVEKAVEIRRRRSGT